MSNYQPSQDNNPWSDPLQEPLHPNQQQVNPAGSNSYYQGGASPNPWAQQASTETSTTSYAPPPGPPPSHQQSNLFSSEQSQNQPHSSYPSQRYDPSTQQQPVYNQQQSPQPPHRASTFNETEFVAPSERGEQREAMENFEMNNSRGPSQDDRNIETLQREFPSLDGALVAAIYGDSKNMGSTREMLGELAGS